jgi:YtkA-like
MRRLNFMMHIPRMILSIAVISLSLVFVAAAPAHSNAETALRCDIQVGPCFMKTGDGIKVEFDVQPKPVKAMTENTFMVTLSRDGLPLKDASIKLDLSMPHMYMGKNQPVLHHVRDGRYEGKGVISRCASGSSTWQADIVIESAGKTVDAAFVFEVK